MGITASIAAAPAPRPTDFSYNPNEAIDLTDIDVQAALEEPAGDDEDAPGSPTARLLRAMAPPMALLADHKWSAVSIALGRHDHGRSTGSEALSLVDGCQSHYEEAGRREW